jgi:hypothetical protein
MSSYQAQLYSLHQREPHAFQVVRATTTFTDLRQLVAQIYGGGTVTAQELFARHYFVLAGLAKPKVKSKKAQKEEKNKTFKHQVLDEAQLYLNNETLASHLVAAHVPKNHKLLVFPSPAHLVRATLRPELRTARASRFAVEIYAPHRHREMRARYEAAREQEAKYTRRSDGTLVARRFVDRLTMPGRVEHDPHMDVTLIAVSPQGEMIGYCESTLVLFPYGREEAMERAEQPFFKDVAAGNLFEIAGLSALPSQGGYQIALVLLYHAFHFAWQHRALLPCSHAVSHSASIVTKTYLSRSFGFAYRGSNLFDNDDAPDTFPPALATQVRDLLRTCCMHMRDALRHCVGGDVRPHASICVALYQLMLWFKFVNSKGLELLLVLQANVPSRYLEGLVRQHLALQLDQRGLGEWLRDDAFYDRNLGLRTPQYGPLKQAEHEVKVPAVFGIDEVVRLLVYVRDLKCDTPIAAVLWRQWAQLQQTIEADCALEEDYVIPGDQLDAVARLLYADDETHIVNYHRQHIEEYIEWQTRVFMELYAVDYMDTHLPFAQLGANLAKVAAQYAQGETKNFITPVQQQPAQPSPAQRFPDDLALLRALMDKTGAHIADSQQFDDGDDEYYHNLRLRHAALSGELGDYAVAVENERSDQ